jgi:geranylgeranylglycerol-phosphate geranylgeranyltransferase
MLAKKLKAIFQIFRPELPFAAGVCVVLGELIALGKFPPFKPGVLGFLCAFFISGSAIVLNDYYDLEVDKINSPNRPLPSGLITPLEAILLTALATAAGLAASLAFGFSSFMLCAIFWIIGFLYNWKFKAAGLVGNLMVSSSVAITFLLGGMAVGQPWNKIIWCFALIAFFIDLGEEIAGDAMDMEGDQKRDSKSIAIRYGRKFALAISSACFALVVLLSFVPALFHWLGISYLVMIAIMDLIICVFTARLLKSKTPEDGRTSMRQIYMGALFGMLAFIIGKMI